MKILIVSQYFWPEYFRVNDLVRELKTKNLNIDVLTGLPNYPGGSIYKDFKKNKNFYSHFHGANIYRVPLIPRKSGNKFFLTLNYISFLLFGFVLAPFLLRNKKYDLIITFGTSPILVGLLSVFLSKIKKSRHFLWVLDLWPNVLQDLNILKSNSFLYKICLQLVVYIYNSTDLILCQSLSFKKEISKMIQRGKEKLIFFPSWPEELDQKISLKQNKNIFEKSYVNVVFAGNIGESQNFEYLIKEVFLNFKDKEIKWHIFGEGRNIENIKQLKNAYELNNLIFHGHVSFQELYPILLEADFLLVTLRYEKTFAYTIPGKFQTYINYNKPILAFCGGEVKRLVNKYHLGLAFDYKEIPTFENLKTYLDKKLFFKNKREFLIKLFSKERLINKILWYSNKYEDLFYKKIQVIESSKSLDYSKNFVLCGLNLAYLGYYSSGNLGLYDSQIFWPDGFYRKTILTSHVNKVPGRKIIQELSIDKKIIKKIYIIGTAHSQVLDKINSMFNHFHICHIDLPISNNYDDFLNLIPKFEESDIAFITLPTPKQEILADLLRKKNKFFKLLCIGGALNMIANIEKPIPESIENFYFAESIWRLQGSTLRRIHRAIRSLFYYFIGVRKGIFNKIKYTIIK